VDALVLGGDVDQRAEAHGHAERPDRRSGGRRLILGSGGAQPSTVNLRFAALPTLPALSVARTARSAQVFSEV
jgi:hypothetical protein